MLLDGGWSCAEVAAALLIDDDTVRSWHGLHVEHGLTGLVVFGYQGSRSHLSREAEAALVDWVRANLPRNTRMIGAWIAKTHGVAYSHAGLIALLHRLKIVYRKPDLISANPRIKSGGGPRRGLLGAGGREDRHRPGQRARPAEHS